MIYRLRAPVGVHVRPMSIFVLAFVFLSFAIGVQFAYLAAVASALKQLPEITPEYSSRLFLRNVESLLILGPLRLRVLFFERAPEAARVWVTPLRILSTAFYTLLAAAGVCFVLA